MKKPYIMAMIIRIGVTAQESRQYNPDFSPSINSKSSEMLFTPGGAYNFY